MDKDRLSRRTFLRNTSVLAAGAVAGALAGKGCTSSRLARSTDTSKILNYNANMGYRRLGK
ncbi:MAG: twin-arginine translocation signal domain-containing protein, partial [Candidatus Hydrogenedentota bacterium]